MSARPPTDEPALLDWRAAEHWSTAPRPCRYCAQPTNLRDSKRSPAHKVCAETALATQAAEAADTYQKDTL
jgi:hypothetical protein